MTKITNFVWNAVDDSVISEMDGAGSVQAVYTNEPQQYGGVVSQRRGTTTSTYHADALGTTRALTDGTQTTTDTYLNDAWGNNVVSAGTTVNPFKWVGKFGYYTDSSTAQVYVRARMYQPALARWASVDPLLFVDGPNVFVYVLNAALNTMDSSGTSFVYSPQPPDPPLDGKYGYSFIWHIYLPDEKNWPPPGVNVNNVKQLQLWQINTRSGFRLVVEDGRCKHLDTKQRIIDIFDVSENFVFEDEGGRKYVKDQSGIISGSRYIVCFAQEQVRKKIGFNSATSVQRTGTTDDPTDKFWDQISQNMRGPTAEASYIYLFASGAPECKCCIPKFVLDRIQEGFESLSIDGGKPITSTLEE